MSLQGCLRCWWQYIEEKKRREHNDFHRAYHGNSSWNRPCKGTSLITFSFSHQFLSAGCGRCMPNNNTDQKTFPVAFAQSIGEYGLWNTHQTKHESKTNSPDSLNETAHPSGSYFWEKCADCGTQFKLKMSQYCLVRNTLPPESRIPFFQSHKFSACSISTNVMHCKQLYKSRGITFQIKPSQRVLFNDPGNSQGEEM